MAEEKQTPEEPTQETPQGHKIPVPTHKQVFRDLEKVAKGRRGSPKRTPSGRKPGKPSEPS
jgi:hypothetical protein